MALKAWPGRAVARGAHDSSVSRPDEHGAHDSSVGRPGEHGAAMVEFVLTAGILFLLLFGMLDLGLALNAKLVVAAAAREGARRAAIEGGETAAVLERVQAQLRLGLVAPEQATIRVTPREASYGNSVAVMVEYTYPFISPVVRALAGEGILLHAEAVSRSEKLR